MPEAAFFNREVPVPTTVEAGFSWTVVQQSADGQLLQKTTAGTASSHAWVWISPGRSDFSGGGGQVHQGREEVSVSSDRARGGTGGEADPRGGGTGGEAGPQGDRQTRVRVPDRRAGSSWQGGSGGVRTSWVARTQTDGLEHEP